MPVLTVTAPLSSAEQLITPLASAVSVPPLVKLVQSSVLIFNPPPARTTPLAKVEVADVPFTFKTPLVCTEPTMKVEVPEPLTCNAPGVVVTAPMPNPPST